MKRETITANFLKTICWFGNSIVDWPSAGNQFFLGGGEKQLWKYHFSSFNSAIVSADGQYSFVSKRLGTKGLLLKNGELLREINRSYYYAEVYEYPAAFITIEDVTYLIHCPLEYGRLDFENVETGELVTDVEGRDPSGVFHSRLEVSGDNRWLMSKGWVWHPLDRVEIFDIGECIKNPLLLDRSSIYPSVGTEVCTASFINESKVLIGSSDELDDDDEISDLPPKYIGVWDFASDKITGPVKVNGEFGNLFAINDEFAWDTFEFPKIINIKTGEIVDRDESVDSGKQRSSMMSNKSPQIVFNRETKQLAITGHEKIEVLTPPDWCF